MKKISKGNFAKSVASQPARDASEEVLNALIKKLQDEIAAMPEKQRLTPDVKLLTKHFDKNQRSALFWG